MIEITDEMCRRAVEAWACDRIQGFSTPNDGRTRWGAPHYIRDVMLSGGEQELWRGDSQDEMFDRCEIEKMRLSLHAAFNGRE